MFFSILFFGVLSVPSGNLEDASSVKVEIPSTNVTASEEKMNFSTKTADLEFSASSWFPNHWQSQGRMESSSNKQSFPAMEVRLISKPLVSSIGLSSFFGMGLLSVRTQAGEYAQRSYFIPTHFGAEVAPSWVSVWKFSPFVRFSVSPTLILSHDSVVADGQTDWAVPFTTAAGTHFNFSKAEPNGFKRLLPSGLSVEWMMTRGGFGKQNLSGMGFAGSLRFTI
jgi:hypothetical protein